MSHKFDGMWTKVTDPAARDNMLIGSLQYKHGDTAPPEVILVTLDQIIPFYNQVLSVMNGSGGRLEDARDALGKMWEFAKLFVGEDGEIDKTPSKEQWAKMHAILATWDEEAHG